MFELDHLKAMMGGLYGGLYIIMAVWLIIRGSRENWGRRVPGRVVLGVFLIFSCYREWDTVYVLLRYGRTSQATIANTDVASVLPLVIGGVFGIWAAYRFFRNTVGSDAPSEPDRVADATERIATATEIIAEQGETK